VPLGRLTENSEPGERVLPEEVCSVRGRHLLPTEAAGSVRADQIVAAHLTEDAVGVGEPNAGGARGDVDDLGAHHAKVDLGPVTGAGVGEIGEDGSLGIEPDRRAHQVLEVDVVTAAAKTQLDPAVLVTVLQDAPGHPAVDEEPHAVALEDARPDRRLDLMPRTDVDRHRVDAGHVQQVAQHQPGRAASHDPDGRAARGWTRHGR